jgi:broad specificity phosphatase PhoE
MIRLHLIRHGRPLVDAKTSASTWSLVADDEPFRSLTAAPGFPRFGRWVSSSEPKALDTARVLRHLLDLPADDFDRTAALREMRRPAGWTQQLVFEGLVRASVENPSEPAAAAWETAASVLERVGAEVRRQCERSEREGSGEVVLVGHGTAWSLLVAATVGLPVDVAGWQRMRMPDWCVLDATMTAGVLTGYLEADWGAWAT